MAPVDDFIMTLDSDAEETGPLPPPRVSRSTTKAGKSKAADTAAEDALLNPEFSFDFAEDTYVDIFGETVDTITQGSKPVRTNF
jgi:hypothetical protein